METYGDVVKGIFAVKGLGQKKSAMVSNLNLDLKPKEYADKLRLFFMNMSSMTKKIEIENLEKMVFELDDYYLILQSKTTAKGRAPLFLSLLTNKDVDFDSVDMIFENLSADLFLLLR
jgi:hypothetical protein